MTLKEEKNLKDLHKSVLLFELVNGIKIFKDKQNIIVDCTLGMAGHAREVIKKLNSGDIFVGFDADKRNLDIAKPYLEQDFRESGIKLLFVNDNFYNLRERLTDLGIDEITGIYYDLGISSLHIDEADRGFSFKLDGPLDMRFDNSKGITASQIVNSYKEDELIRIFREYGEEQSSKKIAGEIITQRKKGFRFKTTKDLADLIGKISKFPKSKNRIFQALRIEVNDELGVIEKSVLDAISLLKKGGNIFIISFHSLEDRIVKNIFKNESKDCICRDLICNCKHKKCLQILTKKPILPTSDEIKINPRSRSAKARLALKI
ncbi:MAG: 16S rRNA (cytosine(1402)-N(4))-methyltransferase RsmH [Candidatus Gracilibacteria bacterium]|nr:16S rRNA (cytosine(1402)-N(4))-methyltransferase RsmH [Candidatus Gracilibacteria bacterium]